MAARLWFRARAFGTRRCFQNFVVIFRNAPACAAQTLVFGAPKDELDTQDHNA
jgi:hypothetical protein